MKGASTILMLMKKTISYQSNTKSFVGLRTKLVTECQPRDEAKCCKTPEYFLMDMYQEQKHTEMKSKYDIM